jgi:hypothetical protein
MKVDKFIEENINLYDIILHNYSLLNTITFPDKVKKFPYNVLSVEVNPTYKSMELHIKDKKFYADAPKKNPPAGGDITVFLF